MDELKSKLEPVKLELAKLFAIKLFSSLRNGINLKFESRSNSTRMARSPFSVDKAPSSSMNSRLPAVEPVRMDLRFLILRIEWLSSDLRMDEANDCFVRSSLAGLRWLFSGSIGSWSGRNGCGRIVAASITSETFTK